MDGLDLEAVEKLSAQASQQLPLASIQPEPPAFLRVYQPLLRYYLIDEGRYTAEELGQSQTPLSGVFGIENAVGSREALQLAVDRIVAIIQNDPHKDAWTPSSPAG